MKKPIKKCKNPECQDVILEYKSAKRNYCNDSCRNRAGYLNRLVEEREFELEKMKAKLNYKALKQCINKNYLEIDLTTLELLNFDINYLKFNKLLVDNNEQYKAYKIKDIEFYYNSTKAKMIIIKT